MQGHHDRTHYFDNIEEVEKRRFGLFKKDLPDIGKPYTHIRIDDTWEVRPDGDIKEVVEVYAIKYNKERIVILTDGALFLMNDEGKTIERIN
jgi:hypothetical protein